MNRAVLLAVLAALALVGLLGTVALLRTTPAGVPAVLTALAGLVSALRA